MTLEGEELRKLISDNKWQELVFVEYSSYKVLYAFNGVDGLRYNVWCGDTYNDTYRDAWRAIERVGDLVVDDNVFFAICSKE